jgi:hypothetical protein
MPGNSAEFSHHHMENPLRGFIARPYRNRAIAHWARVHLSGIPGHCAEQQKIIRALPRIATQTNGRNQPQAHHFGVLRAGVCQ